MKTALTDDDYEQIAARLKDEMDDTFQAMQASQGKLQGAIDQQLAELKTLTEKTTTIHTQLIKTAAGESSTQSISCEEILIADRINTVLIPPGSIRFPASMKDVPKQIRQPIEVNIVEFHIDQLQMIQQQLSTELRGRELATHQQNTQLKQNNAALTTSFQKKADELRTYEEREQYLSQVL